jgi:hypothetical protein
VNEAPIAQNSTSNPYSTFTNASATGFTATLSSGVAYAGFGGVSGSSGDSVTVSFDLDIVSGSPKLALRASSSAINDVSNGVNYTSSGSYSLTMTATGNFSFIGFSEGDLPSEFTVSNFEITSVSGATYVRDGFVTQWYDQSGNDNHATQGTNASQPKIVDGGSLVSGGLEFDGVDDTLVVTGNPVITANYAGTYSAFSVQTIATSVAGYIAGNASPTNGSSLLARASSDFTLSNKNNGNFDNISRAAGKNILSACYNNGDASLLVNGGGSMVDAGAYDFSAGTSDFRIGSRNPSNIFLEGKIEEIIIYNTDQSDNRTAIEANIGETYDIDLPSGVDTGYDQVDGFVETWYDQSGNGNDATQQVSGSQPKIVDAGVLVSGGLEFDGVDDRLTCSSLYSSDISIFNVVTTSNTVNTNNFMRMIHLCDGSDSFQLTRGGNAEVEKLISKNTAFQSGVTAFLHGDINGENLISAVTSSTDTDAFVDGSLRSNGSASGLGSGNNTTTTIGARDDLVSSTFFAGSHAEIIIYPSDQSANRAAIETNINNQYDIY